MSTPVGVQVPRIHSGSFFGPFSGPDDDPPETPPERLDILAAGARAIPALLEVLTDEDETLSSRQQALALLERLEARELSANVGALLDDPGTDPALRTRALQSAEHLAGIGTALPSGVRRIAADPTTPTDDAETALRALMLARPAEAVSLLEHLLDGTAPERARAIGVLPAARDPAFRPLLLREMQKPPVREKPAPFAEALAHMKGRAFDPVQMTGPPDTPLGLDLHSAWAAREAEMGEVWVELDFPEAVRATALRVRENCAPGAITLVLARTPEGEWEPLWEGDAGVTKPPRWFEPEFAALTYETRSIRMVLDTDRVKGWNEIDAVELVAGDVRQWASEARARSSFADR